MRAVLPLLLGLVGCQSTAPPMTYDAAPRVAVAEVRAVSGGTSRTMLTTLEPIRDAVLTPMRPGVVVERVVEPGVAVATGDPILRLDARESRARLATATAAVADADAAAADAARALVRVEALGDGASQATVDSAATAVARSRAAVEHARAQAQLAQADLRWMTLRAPFAGVVASLEPELGEAVGTVAPAARVVDVESLKATIGLHEDELMGAASPDASFEVRTTRTRATAELVWMSPAADPRTLAWAAELHLPGAEGLAAGMPVDVVLSLSAPGADGVVPAVAVVDGSVWEVTDGVARRTPVSVLGEGPEGVFVIGIRPGAQVVVHGPEALSDGVEVVVLGGSP